MAALADAPRPGRPLTADATYHVALDDLVDRDPRALGLPFDAWTSARLSAYLVEMTGVRITPGWMRVLLAQHRLRCGRPKHTLDHLRDPQAVAACEAAIAAAEKKVAQAPERYERRYQDETHVETNPYLAKQWHRIGKQQRIASVGVNRRVTVFGSKESRGRGRVEVVCGGQDSACFAQYLTALEQQHMATGREVFLVLDHASCHTSRASERALAARMAWLHLIWLAKYSPHLNKKEREWRYLKRDVRGHLARDLRSFVDEIVDGLDRLGGEERLIIDAVPQ
ncbi:MAG: IS630 family transposase, partial [Chloroflexota bacterium]|nr:IS630 family transposase [Chloroflexota bacterium]